MTDCPAFLAAIIAAPDDDLPRLIYADWLDDQGEHARAEFVRVQCEIAAREAEQASGGSGPKRFIDYGSTEALRRRERQLLMGLKPQSLASHVFPLPSG